MISYIFETKYGKMEDLTNGKLKLYINQLGPEKEMFQCVGTIEMMKNILIGWHQGKVEV